MAEHMLIDGYNVIHAIKEFKKNLAFGVNAAAQIFVQEASKLLIMKDKVTLVFDGNGSNISIEYPCDSKRFCVIYSSIGISADTLIERIVRKSKIKIDCTVITNDHGLGNTIRSIGGITLSAEEFVNIISSGESICRKRMTLSDRSFGNKLFK
jgi:predicted RNA-binding protein with PIN domain